MLLEGRKKQNGTLNAFFIEPIHRLLLLRQRSDKTKSARKSQWKLKATEIKFEHSKETIRRRFGQNKLLLTKTDQF